MQKKNVQRDGLNILTAAMLGLSLLAGIVAAPVATEAAPAAQGSSAVKVTTVPANGTATLTARGFCLQFGKPFPTQSMGVNGLAPDKVRNALNYAISKGYTASNAQQVQLAVWYLQDNTWHNQNNTVAQEIVTNANTGTLPTANALALTDAITQKSVNVSVTFVPQTADAFYGDGKITVKNTTSAALNIYVPVGVDFTVPNGAGQFQDLAVYELVQADPTATVSATTTVSGTATAGATTSPAATASASVSTTALATGTAVTSPTAVASAVVTTPTEVATAVASTPSAAATTEVSTPTTAPTATTVSSTLPQTGGDGTPGILLALLVTALAMAGLGLLMRLKLRA